MTFLASFSFLKWVEEGGEGGVLMIIKHLLIDNIPPLITPFYDIQQQIIVCSMLLCRYNL